jgi:hypothetical protein
MVAGAGALGLAKVVAMLVGMVAIWRSNRAGKTEDGVPEDKELARRQAERAETERRMRAYLASRDQRTWHDDDA